MLSSTPLPLVPGGQRRRRHYTARTGVGVVQHQLLVHEHAQVVLRAGEQCVQCALCREGTTVREQRRTPNGAMLRDYSHEMALAPPTHEEKPNPLPVTGRRSRASPPHRPRDDWLTHPADTSSTNLAAAWVCFRGGGFPNPTSTITLPLFREVRRGAPARRSMGSNAEPRQG